MKSPHLRTACVLALAAVCTISSGCRKSPAEKEAVFLKKGQELYAKRDYSRALLQFRSAMSVMPKDAEPVYQLGMTFVALRDARDAAMCFRKALQLNANHQGAKTQLALLEAALGDKELTTQARSELEQLVKANPSNADAYDALAVSKFRLGDAGDAEKDLESLLSRNPGRLASVVELARMKMATHDVAGAESVLKNAANANPKSIDARLLLAQFYLQTNRTDDAAAQGREALKIDGKNARALALVAQCERRSGHRDAAEAMLKQVSLMPDKELQPLYGVTLFEDGKTDAAIAEFKRLADADHSDREARMRLVRAYLMTHRTADAESVLRQALKANAHDGDALQQVAAIDLLNGNVPEAETNLQALLHLSPQNPTAHVLMAQVYQREGKPTLVRQELVEAVRLSPGFLQARLALAADMEHTGAAQSAIATLEEAPAAQKQQLAWRLAHNTALLANQDYAAVEKDLAGAVQSGNPQLMLQYSQLRFQQKDYSGAREVLEKLAAANPQNPKLVDAIARTWVASQQTGKALQTVRDFAAAQKASPAAQQLLAVWLATTGDKQSSMAVLQANLAQNPNYEPSEVLAARMDTEQRHCDAAEPLLRNVLKSNPGNVDARLLSGQCDLSRGDQAHAVEDFKAVLKYDQTNWMALNNLAYLLVNSNPEDAVKYAQAALQVRPNDANVEDTAGWVFLHKDMTGQAVSELEAAAAKDNAPLTKYHLALAYLKSGQRDKGQQMLNGALLSDPNLVKTQQQQDWALWKELTK